MRKCSYPLFVFCLFEARVCEFVRQFSCRVLCWWVVFPPIICSLNAWFFEETFARESFRWFVPSLLSLSLLSQLSSEGQLVILFCATSAFGFLSCLSGSWWLLNFAELFTVDVVWGFWLFLLDFTNWSVSVDWLYQFVPMRSLFWLLWVCSESSGCLLFPSFESLGTLLEVCSTNVREDPCCKLFWSQSIRWFLIPVLLFAVFSTVCPTLRLQDLFDTTASLPFFRWLSGEELSVSFRKFNYWYLSMLSPISIETEQLVLFRSVNVGHESCGCNIDITLRRLLSDDDSLELLEELCLLRRLYLFVILGCNFVVPCVSVWYEGAYSVAFVIGLSPEASTVSIFDLDRPFIIFLHFSNVVVRSPERSTWECGVLVSCKDILGYIIQTLVQACDMFQKVVIRELKNVKVIDLILFLKKVYCWAPLNLTSHGLLDQRLFPFICIWCHLFVSICCSELFRLFLLSV